MHTDFTTKRLDITLSIWHYTVPTAPRRTVLRENSFSGELPMWLVSITVTQYESTYCCCHEWVTWLKRIWGRRHAWRPENRVSVMQKHAGEAGVTKREHGEEFSVCICAGSSTCEGSVTLSVTTSSLVYLMKRWCSSNSCIFHILNLLSWSKNWKNLTTKKIN